jgi:thymidylate kinase
VRNGYKTIARENPTRVKMIEVDGLSEADLHSQIINIIDNALKSKNAK